ncbi:MAG: hypothetical protein GWP91_24855 [Rhodobacterales bacterium]|nr:hypothetical protein [Rhodobacterales bacterium]
MEEAKAKAAAPNGQRRQHPPAQTTGHIGSGLCVVSSAFAVSGTIFGMRDPKARQYSSLLLTGPAAVTSGVCLAMLHGGGQRAGTLLGEKQGLGGRRGLAVGLSMLGTAALMGGAVSGTHMDDWAGPVTA